MSRTIKICKVKAEKQWDVEVRQPFSRCVDIVSVAIAE